MTKRKPPTYLWALFDSKGILCGVYDSRQEADDDAWGPRFRARTIRYYQIVPKKEEPKDDTTRDA